MSMIRCTPPMEQVCESPMLVGHHFLHTIHENCIFLMFFVFLLIRVVCCLFHNMLQVLDVVLVLSSLMMKLRTPLTMGTSIPCMAGCAR